MSLKIRQIELNNFRKFRKPVSIGKLSDGLNIIIEPNEVGKSTLLEALRAALFVRHSTKNQLASSFMPNGENVAPEVTVAFDIGDIGWRVSKRFLKNAFVEVEGPDGRTQGDVAEEQLQHLLGFERDTSRSGDTAAYGALGLLWVAQAEALEVTPPGHIVRDTVRSTLEHEVGAIMGGAAYDRVRTRVDQQYLEYWTATGRPAGQQTASKTRAEVAAVAAKEALETLQALERTMTELDQARARLSVLQREMADDTDQKTRESLVSSIDTARAAALLLSKQAAEHENLSGRLSTLEDVKSRYVEAKKRHDDAIQLQQDAAKKRKLLTDKLALAEKDVITTRSALSTARTNKQTARLALIEGEKKNASIKRLAATRAARVRFDELIKLELLLADFRATSATTISAKSIEELEENERSIAKARAELAAGATIIELFNGNRNVLLDGNILPDGQHILTKEVSLQLGGTTALVVRPPATSGSAEAQLEDAIARQRSALETLGVETLAAARAVNEAARDASSEERVIAAKISALTFAVPELDLAAGVEALKLFAAKSVSEFETANTEMADIAELTKSVDLCENELIKADLAQQNAIDALRTIEDQDKPLAADEAAATSDVHNATAQMKSLEERPEFNQLDDLIIAAKEDVAEAAVKLEDATRNASAHDIVEIERKIKIIDDRATAAGTARRGLEMDIARLEGIADSEGGKGLAEREANAREESESAQIAMQNILDEADTIKLLRETLEEARAEAAQVFVGPVAKKAERHIAMLFPDISLSFSESLNLESITRSGQNEECSTLSRGTQEQLAVLTRLALAELLLEQGLPVSLILDDPLVYSDDGRLDIMTDILIEASTRMQVILLTCRDRAFRHVSANRISIGES